MVMLLLNNSYGNNFFCLQKIVSANIRIYLNSGSFHLKNEKEALKHNYCRYCRAQR